VDGGKVRQITNDFSYYGGARASGDGKTLVAKQLQYFVTIQLSPHGQELDTKTLSIGNQAEDGGKGMDTTPDGKIIYTSFHNQRVDLWEMGADGSNPQRLTNTDSSTDLGHPAASSRGGLIAYLGRDGIWRMDMDGGNKKQITHGGEWDPAISPDGKWVVFVRGQGGQAFLVKAPSEGGPGVELTDKVHDTTYWPTISPDGKWIACMYFHNGHENTVPSTLAIFPIDGGKPSKVFSLTDFSRVPLFWTPDGRSVSYVHMNTISGQDDIWEQPLAGGPPKPATHFTTHKIASYAWLPDGRLVVSRSTRTNDAVLIRNFQ
jgi:Tol biopolymer transport system component